MELLKHTPHIKWSPTGEVSIRGKIIPNSNISELVNDIFRHRHRVSSPTERQSFIESLAEENIPRDLIGNVQKNTLTLWTRRASGVAHSWLAVGAMGEYTRPR